MVGDGAAFDGALVRQLWVVEGMGVTHAAIAVDQIEFLGIGASAVSRPVYVDAFAAGFGLNPWNNAGNDAAAAVSPVRAGSSSVISVGLAPWVWFGG